MAAISLKCLFCQQETEFDHREVLMEYDIWICKNCPHDTHMYVHENGHIGASMVVGINDNVYTVDMWHPECPFGVRTLSKEGYTVTTVFTLPFVPDWNPTNIEAKLRAVLTFL